mgnify:CR=1 FL=1
MKPTPTSLALAVALGLSGHAYAETAADARTLDTILVKGEREQQKSANQNVTVLKASAIVYGIPIIGLILGVVVGSRFGEIYAAIGGVALSGLSFLILKKLEPKFAKMNEFKPRMTAFVNEEGKE